MSALAVLLIAMAYSLVALGWVTCPIDTRFSGEDRRCVFGLIWPLVLLYLVFEALSRLNPWTEESQLNRRIRAVERETRLLEKRRELERAEAKYRAELDRDLDRLQAEVR